MPVQTGNELKRGADEEEDLRPTSLLKKTKDPSAVARVARGSIDFREAAKVCSEALQDKRMTNGTRVHHLLTRSSLYSKLNESTLAIKDAKDAVILAPNDALCYVRAAKAFHQAGHKAKANQALEKASSLISLNADRRDHIPAETSKVDLGSHVKGLFERWNQPRINFLPDEVLIEMFSYLDRPDLMRCVQTCKRWQLVTSRSQALWREHVTLRGTMKQINAQWTRICGLAGGPKVRSISLCVSPAPGLSWQEFRLSKQFPSETLEKFEYSYKIGAKTDRLGDDTSFNQSVWRSICTCKQLRSIRWSIARRHPRSDVSFIVKASDNLRSCRLEEFIFETDDRLRLDESFVEVLSEAKRIHLSNPIAESRMREILSAAKDTLEELHLVGVLRKPTSLDSSWVPSGFETPIGMGRLRTYQAHYHFDKYSKAVVYNLRAPQVSSLSFAGEGMTDHTLIESCMDNVIRLEYVGSSTVNNDLFRSRPLHLPLCEDLSLHFNVDDEFSTLMSVFERARTIGTTADIVNKALPRLNHLQISCARELTGGEMVKLLASRGRLQLAPLNTLVLSSCSNLHPASVAWLRKHVTAFSMQNGLSVRSG
ncbi:hypothetical protein CBS101457_005415 [Exobasidium rhododendri]|nr:hypothetical protein CBS101457_005415 [Exobasidium rhododendri]